MRKNFRFDEQRPFNIPQQKPSTGGMIGFLIKKGIVKSPEQANAILLGFVIVGICLIIYINYRTFGD